MTKLYEHIMTDSQTIYNILDKNFDMLPLSEDAQKTWRNW